MITEFQESLVSAEWIQEQAADIPHDKDDKSFPQILALFGEYVLLEAEREHNRRMAAALERAQEIPY